MMSRRIPEKHGVGLWRHSIRVSIVAAAATLSATPAFASDDARVGQVMAGQLDHADASWWGFDPVDSTRGLQSAIDSGVRTLVIPDMGRPWIVRPITLRSNLTIRFEDGAEVLAMADEFHGKQDSLFSATNVENLSLVGKGVLRMRKADYADPAKYQKAEWRMTLALRGCRNVLIEDLTFADSGGDGIYLGVASAERPWCEDITIRRVDCVNNYRQGISVISARRVLIEDSIFRDTSGAPPAAGIDLEPNDENEYLQDVTIRRCIARNNEGAGMMAYLRELSGRSQPLSVVFEDCRVEGSGTYGLMVGAVKTDGPAGSIIFRRCVVQDTARPGVYVYDKDADNAQIQFLDCRWTRVATGLHASSMDAEGEARQEIPEYERVPFLIYARRPQMTRNVGGVVLSGVLEDDQDRPVLIGAAAGADCMLSNVRGSLQVTAPGTPHARYDLPTAHVDLELKK